MCCYSDFDLSVCCSCSGFIGQEGHREAGWALWWHTHCTRAKIRRRSTRRSFFRLTKDYLTVSDNSYVHFLKKRKKRNISGLKQDKKKKSYRSQMFCCWSLVLLTCYLKFFKTFFTSIGPFFCCDQLYEISDEYFNCFYCYIYLSLMLFCTEMNNKACTFLSD